MKLVVIWEHEYDKMIREDPDAESFVKNLDLVERLNPRDSLMGGRTNGCVLYKRAVQGTKIKYVDLFRYILLLTRRPGIPLVTPKSLPVILTICHLISG
jgi:hypothetical protein